MGRARTTLRRVTNITTVVILTMSKKRKNYINMQESLDLFKSFGFRVVEMNWYTLRIAPEEGNKFYDWYHTTGSTVVNKKGINRRMGIFYNAEALAEHVI